VSDVKVYTHPDCSPCDALERELDERGIDYEKIDISESKEARRRLVDKLGYATVPAVEEDGKIVQVGV